MRTPGLVACALTLLAAAARADVLHVPGEFATIQDAVNASLEGDTILVAPGTYNEQVSMLNHNNVTLRGQGQAEIAGEPLDSGLTLVGCIGSTVEKMHFRGGSLAVRVTGCLGVTLRKCHAEEMDESAFQVDSSTDTLVDRCVVDGAVDTGLIVSAALGVDVRRCTFRDVNVGIDVDDSFFVELDRPRVEHAQGSGILLGDGCPSTDVHHARLIDIDGAGLSVASDGCHFAHDVMIDAIQGIVCQSTAERNVFEHERVVDSGDVAYSVGGENEELHHCRAIHSDDTAFLCADTGGHLLQDCRAMSPASRGVLVNGNCTGCTIQDCKVVHTGDSAIDTEGDDTTLVGNVVTDAGFDGFRIESDLNVLIDNKAHGSAEFDLLDLQGTSTYVDNDFGTVGT